MNAIKINSCLLSRTYVGVSQISGLMDSFSIYHLSYASSSDLGPAKSCVKHSSSKCFESKQKQTRKETKLEARCPVKLCSTNISINQY